MADKDKIETDCKVLSLGIMGNATWLWEEVNQGLSPSIKVSDEKTAGVHTQ